MKEVKKKVCLVGDPAVGKTSLIRRFVLNKYDDEYISTLGTKVSKKTIVIKEIQRQLTMVIWDLAGQKEFHDIQVASFKDATGALVVGDITRKDTMDNIENWIASFTKIAGPVPIVLLANKYDLKEEAEVTEKYLKHNTSTLNVPYFLTSAKTGENVEAAFLRIGKMMTRAIKAPQVVLTERMALRQEIGMASGKDPLQVEDKIIMRFCDIIGDMDFAMSIVRKQFKDAGVDFNNPTYENLKDVSRRLGKVIKDVKGEKTGKEAEREFLRMVEKGRE